MSVALLDIGAVRDWPGVCGSFAPGGTLPAKKYFTWAAVAFVAFYVIREPDGASRSVQSAAEGIASAAGAMATFVTELT